jgi:hypothetical protein
VIDTPFYIWGEVGKMKKIKKMVFPIIIIVLLMTGGYFLTKPSPVLGADQLTNVATPEVLEAYKFADEYGDVFRKAKCYCGCMLNSGHEHHKSLRDCFTSKHGANCFTCVEEALFIGKQKELGINDETIIKKIEDKYSHSGH